MENEKLIQAKIIDKIKLSEKTNKLTYTNMLDPIEFAKVINLLKQTPHIAYGGYELAERKVIFIGFEDIDFDEYLTLIRIESSKELSHRNVLGSILGLGIKREMIGDIIINENICNVIVLKEIANFIVQNLEKVGREKVEVTTKILSELIELKDNSRMMTITVASPRIDAVISACFGVSREMSAELIRKEKVFLNHAEVNSTSKQVKENDIVSVRGFGRVKIQEFSGETRKNRIRIYVVKY